MIDPERYVPAEPLAGLDEVGREPRPVIDDITVVVPTLGRPILEKCVASMVAGDHWPACLIVVDQSHGNETGSTVRRVSRLGLAVRRIVAPKRGRAAALNVGLREVRTARFAVTDDDCVVAPDWLRSMRAALEGHPETIVSGRIEDVGDEASIAHALSRTYELRTKPSLVYDLMSGGNVGMATSSFERVGPFDEDPRLSLAEDTEYAYRALRSGLRLAYVPDVRVWHYAWRDGPQRADQYRGYARSHGSYYGKYIRRGDAFLALKSMLHMGRATRRWVRSRWAGDENMAAQARAYTLELLPGILAGFRSPPHEVEP